MTEDQEKQGLSKLQTQDKRPRCPTCAAFPILMNAFLDSRRGKNSAVRMRKMRRAHLGRLGPPQLAASFIEVVSGA